MVCSVNSRLAACAALIEVAAHVRGLGLFDAEDDDDSETDEYADWLGATNGADVLAVFGREGES